jgi:predicted short-subunit dehydrogenase-like oxidoreductase (DUF2520 family)
MPDILDSNMVKSLPNPRVALIGGGRLGRSILLSIPDRVAAIVHRDPARGEELRALAPDAVVLGSPAGAASREYDVVWIVTGDGAIAGVVEELAGARDDWRGVVVIHSSGATSVAVLDRLRALGAVTLALHPNGSFTGDAPIPTGLVWGLTSRDPVAGEIVGRLLAGLEPLLAPIDDELRPLYHAAASVAANYSITLFAIACDLYMRAGLDPAQAREVVSRFMTASAGNGRSLGPHAALTGPIARGDIDVLREQIRAVERSAPEYLDVLVQLALQTARIADERFNGEKGEVGESSG